MAAEAMCCVVVRSIVSSLVLTALVSCAFERPSSVAPTSYDLGPAPRYARANTGIAGTVLIPAARAPAWLDEPGIAYRLLYEERDQPRIYAMSRWAADPAALLTERIRSRFAAVSGGVVTPADTASADYTLRVDLDDFSQRFDAPAHSRATLIARASLLSTRDRKLVAQRTFAIEREAAPDAAGAVRALTEASGEFVEDLVKWAVDSARMPVEKQAGGN
jgi:cholesterol transport system auxiliary component